jgi:hypothetical protein
MEGKPAVEPKDYHDRFIEEFIDGEWVTRPEPPAPMIDDELLDEKEYNGVEGNDDD